LIEKNKVINFSQVLLRRSLLLFILPVFIFNSGGGYYQTIILEKKKPLFREDASHLSISLSFPIKKTKNSTPSASAKSVYALDSESRTLLFEKNSNKRLAPASLAKLMTALVTLDYCDPKKTIHVRKVPTNGSLMGLVEGEEITIESLLYGLLLPSGNDAAYVLAESCRDSVEQFVYSMNMKALSLGMKNTHFTNPAGLDESENYTTAYDLAILAQESLKNNLIAKIVKTKEIEITDGSGHKIHQLKNLNELLGNQEFVGVKTGKTQAAGENLIVARRKNNHTIILIILGSENRFADGKLISDWIFDNFQWVDLKNF